MYKRILSSLVFVLLMCSQAVLAQSKTVTGKVTSEMDGSPLPGVTVMVKGTSNGTSTDFDGNYTINVGADAVLVFSYVGFATQEVTASGKTTVNVSLAEDTQQLDAVVVTSLGISREKKSLGYATSTIDSEELVETATPNFGTALYGKATGVRISQGPGGSTSPVNIQIRGINSITGRSQPLIVLDGVPIRDGEVNNGNYWGDQRLRGNGLLDINPEDIDNISILKGASAAALYGSEAVNGVVLITTKKGKGRGLGVNFSVSTSFDEVAYLPKYQNVRGPGYPTYLSDAGQDADGFVYYDLDGDGTNETRGLIGTTLNFGPKFDGQPTLSWDGEVRPYNAQTNAYEGLFQTANNNIYNIAITNVTEKSNTRFSYTRQDLEGVSLNSENDKNIFNLNTSFDWAEKFKTDITINYINQTVNNRPYSIDRLTNNFGGMMSRFDNADWYLDHYQTSLGYRFVTGNNQSLTPDENIIYPGYKDAVLDYLWRVNRHQLEEKSDRVIANLTNYWDITKGLQLRGRISTDFTSMRTEDSRATTRPLVYGPSGAFILTNDINKIVYGDVLLTYTKELTPDLEMSLMAGYNATKQERTMVRRATNGGLSVENWFDVAASTNTPNSGSDRFNITKDALIGTANFSYKGFLFVEGTVRRDRTSTMHPDNNAFTYPSVNSSFVFSDAFEMPDFINYGKLRGSWGIVGNYPDIYRANQAYTQNTLGSQGGGAILYTQLPMSQGNDGIRPEEKHEFEFGFETRMFDSKIGLDVSYYNAQIKDQILPLTLPSTSGANSVLTNIGTLRNKGLEVGLNVTPIDGDFTWDVRVNYAKNWNTIEKLAPGLDELQHTNWDGDAAKLVSKVGEPMGDFYVHPVATDDQGRRIVDPNGLYRVDPNEYIKVGNAMPKAVGGVFNSFSYKGFSLDAMVDYRIGGHVMPTAINWMIGRGLTEESLNYMDAEHGGLSWYQDAAGDRHLTDATQGPNGETVYDNGIVLDGVKDDGSTNDYITSNPEYYWTVYNWGGPQYSPNTRYELYVKENTYFKMRELSLKYQIPREAAEKIGFQNIQLSVFGRNLFYLYRTLDHLDAEQTTAGSRWFQSVNNLGTNPSTRTFGMMIRASL
ncbi:SusC/RagA family TonB-linked outer membrane protein [Zhouia amylolytica]|uniref:SusC/RagA family TonB-linked outer membrane protein n=1 Tax=Zhouia amylolytica TaxID=376730 RepID=UPI0020CEE2E3|nr:SusC/RagA family TonB-linked outer membrane protein [Zhouia amylolytica]MCQ0110464.1 SusC/RagA family TonB-linked outer membrane protein [Zhouia amylolytica]